MTTHTATEQAYVNGYQAGYQAGRRSAGGNPGKTDLVEVVRCKDCKNWDTDGCIDGDGWCPIVFDYKCYNWFCADGERKDDG